MNNYLSICYQFRNEAPYLREWIEFHKLVGVEHFFLYDHFSTDDFRSVLDDYIDQGIVTLINWSDLPHHDTAQKAAHEHCLANYGEMSRWIAFIDVDEFLFSPQFPSLKDALKPYETHPGIFINWQVYGSSGHIQRPEGPVIENYTKRAPTDFKRNLKGKSIVNPREATKWNSPHFFFYINDKLAVTENFEPVTTEVFDTPDGGRITKNSITNVSVETFRINHYCVKSLEEYKNKTKNEWEQSRYSRKFFDYHDRNEVVDNILHSYIQKLRDAIFPADSL